VNFGTKMTTLTWEMTTNMVVLGQLRCILYYLTLTACVLSNFDLCCFCSFFYNYAAVSRLSSGKWCMFSYTIVN